LFTELLVVTKNVVHQIKLAVKGLDSNS